jgi:hypothetical protein
MAHQTAVRYLTAAHVECFMSSWRVGYEIFSMSIFQALGKVPALGAAAAIVSLLSIEPVSAATLSLSSGGTAGTLSANFNPSNIAAINADGIHVGTSITIFNGTANTGGLLVLPENVAVTFDFMGKEAAFTNALLIGNSIIFNNNSAPGTTSGPLPLSFGSGPNVLPFLFRNVTSGNLDAINGGAIAVGLQIAFSEVSDSVFYAFFDDGGAGPDADFDDMVVRITAFDLGRGGENNPTPIPAALPLFATGLGALGLLARRRKRKAATVA